LIYLCENFLCASTYIHFLREPTTKVEYFFLLRPFMRALSHESKYRFLYVYNYFRTTLSYSLVFVLSLPHSIYCFCLKKKRKKILSQKLSQYNRTYIFRQNYSRGPLSYLFVTLESFIFFSSHLSPLSFKTCIHKSFPAKIILILKTIFF